VSVSPGLLVAFLLALVRTSAWVALAPPFSSRQIPAVVKIGLSVAIAAFMAPQLAPATASSASMLPVSTAAFLTAVLLQVVTGLALAFVTSLLFSAAQAAGSFVDLLGGFSSATALDPESNTGSGVMGRLFNLLAIVLLFSTGGDLLVLKGFLTSFQAVPLSSFGALESSLLADLSFFFAASLEIAAPLIGVMFVTDMALGLLARVAPQLNILSLSFAIKVVLSLLVVAAIVPMLPGAVDTLVTRSVRDGLSMLRLR
jgi:flagellar biosynthetic protein FliR